MEIAPEILSAGLSLIGGLGEIPGNDLGIHSPEDLMKALTAQAGTTGGGTDVTQLVGGAALRVQSLEPTLLRTMPEQKEFKILNLLPASQAKGISDEWSVKRQHGGFPGSAANGELDAIAETQGTYKRLAGTVKFFMTMRRISGVQLQQDTIVESMAEETLDAITEIKTSLNYLAYYGDDTVRPLEFPGCRKQILDWGDPDLIKDMRGRGLSDIATEIIDLSAAVSAQERYGMTTHFLCSRAVKAREIDAKLDSYWRIGPKDEVKIGTPVRGIKVETNEDGITPISDVFLTEGGMPWEARGGKYADYVTANGLTIPAGISCSAGAHASSKHLAEHAGNYYLAVESTGKLGRSACLVSSQVLVAAGDRNVVTITNPSDPNVTGFVLYKSKRNGVNTKTELREMVQIPRQAGATTVYNDDNQWVAGTSIAFGLDLRPGQNALTWRRLGQHIRLPLYITNTFARTWANIDLRYLRMGKPMNHWMIINILPAGATWRPFN